MDRLSDHYPWHCASDLRGLSVLCLDGDASTASNQSQRAECEFTFTMLLVKLLKTGGRASGVHLISCNHGRLHYELVLRKSGLDLVKLETSGLLKITYLVINGSGSGGIKTDDCNIDNNMEWDEIESMFNGGIISDNTSVLIDDVDVLELISPDPPSCRRLLSLLNYWVHRKDKNGHSQSALILYGRETVGGGPLFSDDASCQPFTAEWCKGLCDVIVHSKNLASGYSSDVHGIVTVISQSGTVRQVMNYKALDSHISCSIVGTKVTDFTRSS